ncbi:unnamed protein product [Effrenium voratum]|uniref:Uncharacterized protein n=1 Tax=Effrenium voratum TaxID=2562239 RepID=A0AA36N8L5_9DINO|nr:unnamed protein product [Effrenium voratum]CAJ1432228.1 unnamed protein product [Effrenium voratum]
MSRAILVWLALWPCLAAPRTCDRVRNVTSQNSAPLLLQWPGARIRPAANYSLKVGNATSMADVPKLYIAKVKSIFAAWGWMGSVSLQQFGPAGVRKFLNSAVIFDWCLFSVAAFLAVLWRRAQRSPYISLLGWCALGTAYAAVIFARMGSHHGSNWLAGYLLELVFLVENVFVFHAIGEAFRISSAAVAQCLVVVAWGQICFDVVFFMGLAQRLRSFWLLPYLLGCWLLSLGVTVLLHTEEEKDAAASPSSSVSERSCSPAADMLRNVLASRVDADGEEESGYLRLKGRDLKVSVLNVATCVLLLADFLLDIDVVLTKIEEIPNSYLAFSSSALATFMIPELFILSQDMLAWFPLLNYGIGLVLCFFGIQMVFAQVVEVEALLSCGIVVSILACCVAASAARSLFEPRAGTRQASGVQRELREGWPIWCLPCSGVWWFWLPSFRLLQLGRAGRASLHFFGHVLVMVGRSHVAAQDNNSTWARHILQWSYFPLVLLLDFFFILKGSRDRSRHVRRPWRFGRLMFRNFRLGAALPGWRLRSWRFQGWEDCYLGFNDPPGEMLHIILSLVRARMTEVDQLLSVAGSMTSLNLLTALRPRQIHFFDMNPCAIAWGKMLLELIAASNSRQEFMSQLFARDLLAFEQTHGGLTYLNQHQYLATSTSPKLREEAQGRLSTEGAEVYREILAPFQELRRRRDWHTPRLAPCEDRRKVPNRTRSGLGSQGRLPADGVASYHYGEGWLASEWTFQQVQQQLRKTPVRWSGGLDFPTASAEALAAESQHGALLFLMDMFSSEFASAWPLHRAQRLQQRCGGLLLAQSITRDRQELLQELNGSSWRSLSDWDSQALLPSEFCRVGVDTSPGCRPPGLSGEALRLCHPLLRQASGADLQLLEELTRDRFSRCEKRRSACLRLGALELDP